MISFEEALEEFANARPRESSQKAQIEKKYAQALHYCKDGNLDLAKIQLRGIIRMDPDFIEAQKLLAFCLIKEEDYSGAWPVLKKIRERQSDDPDTISIMKEVRDLGRAQNRSRKKRNETADMIDGSQNPQPFNSSLLDVWDNTKTAMVNIIIGMIAGLLICMFLIVPAMRQNQNSTAAQALIEANQQSQNQDSTIDSLNAQVAQLQEELEAYTGKDDIVTSYENLVNAQNLAAAEDYEGAAAAMGTINRDLLGATGQSTYDTLTASISEYRLTTSYEAGHTAYLSRNYQEAINQYTITIGVDASYEDGRALYELADSYAKAGDTANAIANYEKLVTELGTSSNRYEAIDDPKALRIPENADGTFSEITEDPYQTTQLKG